MRYTLLVIAVALLAVACGGCSAQYITQQQAEDAVRTFEGNVNLEFRSVELKEYSDGPAWNHDAWYSLETGEAPDEVSYRVDALTGEVTLAGYDLSPFDPVDQSPGPLTQQQCRQIAETFARAKYAGFDTMSFTLAVEEWELTGWHFRWDQTLDYGAVSMNHVDILLNPVDGEIEWYSSDRVPITTVRPPQITTSQAIESAIQAVGIVTVTSVAPVTLFANPDGGSCWRVEITGVDSDGYEVDDVLLVDAETGEIVHGSGPGAGPALPLPSQSILSGRLISLRDLAAKVPGAKVHWLGKDGARLIVGKNRYTLVPGKDTIEWTGGTIKLSQKMTLVNGRLMVPSGLLDALKSAPAPKKAPPASAKSK